MKTTTALNKITTFNSAFDPSETFPNDRAPLAPQAPEEDLINRLHQNGHGWRLVKYCQDLSGLLFDRYHWKTGIGDLREKLCESISETLECNHKQAESLIDLALELIHAKKFRKYRHHKDVNLTCLIAIATEALDEMVRKRGDSTESQ